MITWPAPRRTDPWQNPRVKTLLRGAFSLPAPSRWQPVQIIHRCGADQIRPALKASSVFITTGTTDWARYLWEWRGVLLFVGCLTPQQHARVSQGRICTDNCTCCHTEIEAADQTFHLTQSQYTDTGPTSPSADPITPGAWQGSHWSANF